MYVSGTFRDALFHGASQYGIILDEIALRRFEIYTDILSSWNRRMNLISRRDMKRFVTYHLLDSLKVASCFDLPSITKVMDFGTGAGLPGIPLALAYPHIHVTLVDSRFKRCLFLDEVLRVITSLHATVIQSRGETLPETYNNSFDLVITRATVSLCSFFNISSRFISRGGSLIAIKGHSIEKELQELYDRVDLQFFNISSTIPKAVENVRTGTVVVITRT